MIQSEKYSNSGRGFLVNAREHLAEGDLPQASEKGWGAAAQMVKAIAEQRGWPHRGHSHLYQVVARLVDETGDRQLSTLFGVAGNLHSNFYEDWLPAETVESSLEDVQEFVAKMEQLLQ